MDLLPTLADLAEVELPKNLILDGQSLKRELVKENGNEGTVNGGGGRNGGHLGANGAKGEGGSDDEYNYEDLKPIFYYRGNALFNIRFEDRV